MPLLGPPYVMLRDSLHWWVSILETLLLVFFPCSCSSGKQKYVNYKQIALPNRLQSMVTKVGNTENVIGCNYHLNRFTQPKGEHYYTCEYHMPKNPKLMAIRSEGVTIHFFLIAASLHPYREIWKSDGKKTKYFLMSQYFFCCLSIYLCLAQACLSPLYY